MREIKFRAWNGNRIIGWKELMRDWGDLRLVFAWPDDNGIPGGDRGKWKVMQYTGLKDKNGKEIYEGDVFQFGSNKEWARGNCDRGEVVWHEKLARFGLDFYSIYGGEGYTGKTQHLIDFIQGEKAAGNYREIIGNIYENPDLLENND